MSLYSPGVNVRYYQEIRAVSVAHGEEDGMSPVAVVNAGSEYAVESFYEHIQAMKQQV